MLHLWFRSALVTSARTRKPCDFLGCVHTSAQNINQHVKSQIDPGLLALVEQPAPQSLADSTQSTDERLTESVDIQDLSGVERQEHCESFAESMFLTCHTESEPDEDDLEISFVSQTSQLTESECE